MAAVHPVLFEQAIANLLTAAGFHIVALRREEKPFQFVFEDHDKHRNAIRVAPDKLSQSELEVVADHLKYATTDIDRFILVTPKQPGTMNRSRFARALRDVPMSVEWVTGNALSSFLGLGEELDLSAPGTMDELQMAAITSNLEKYLEPKDRSRLSRSGNLSEMIQSARRRISELPPEYLMLRRQFPFGTIRRLTRKRDPLAEQLLIGGQLADVTVVLSDLKNFSTLVTRAGEETLKQVMSQYYRRSRDLVWGHGGVLDKFIGDAVLAIFNYPYMSATAPMRAVAFARDLIALGDQILPRLNDSMKQPVETGTRVGICSGDLWILDIGQDEIEVSFFGDTINLAARLESNAVVDSLLMDARTRALIEAQDPGLLEILAPKRRVLSPTMVKGQGEAVDAFQVPYAAMMGVEIVPERRAGEA